MIVKLTSVCKGNCCFDQMVSGQEVFCCQQAQASFSWYVLCICIIWLIGVNSKTQSLLKLSSVRIATESLYACRLAVDFRPCFWSLHPHRYYVTLRHPTLINYCIKKTLLPMHEGTSNPLKKLRQCRPQCGRAVLAVWSFLSSLGQILNSRPSGKTTVSTCQAKRVNILHSATRCLF